MKHEKAATVSGGLFFVSGPAGRARGARL